MGSHAFKNARHAVADCSRTTAFDSFLFGLGYLFFNIFQKSVIAKHITKQGLPIGEGVWHPPHWVSHVLLYVLRWHFFYLPIWIAILNSDSRWVGTATRNQDLVRAVVIRVMRTCSLCLAPCIERSVSSNISTEIFLECFSFIILQFKPLIVHYFWCKRCEKRIKT